MAKKNNTNFFIIITTIIVVAIIAIAIFAYNYSNVFKKYNTYNLDTKEILSYNEILSGVELITVMNKIDNINRKNKYKVETDRIIEEHEEYKKLFNKNKNKSNSDNENINENDYMKITVKILMPNEKYNPMSLSREEKEKEEENNIKKEEKYITLDMEKILKNGITNFAELFGKSRFKRKNVLYYDNTNNIREITYIKEGEY